MKITKDKYKEILEIQGVSYNENSRWFTESLNKINKALTIPNVVGQSEQLFCGVKGGFCPYEESDMKCRAEHKCANQVAK
jgi:hypothetical protein